MHGIIWVLKLPSSANSNRTPTTPTGANIVSILLQIPSLNTT